MKLVKIVSVASNHAPQPQPSRARRFLSWAKTAAEDERVNAAFALARAYLSSKLPQELRRDAGLLPIARLDELRRDLESCLSALVEDESILVRRALADALAAADDAPRNIIIALAEDQAEVASIVLSTSPLLSDAELVECAITGGESERLALANRSRLRASVAARLAELGGRDVVVALIRNLRADLSSASMRVIADRFIDEGEVRAALLTRSDLPTTVRFDVVRATFESLSYLVAKPGIPAGRIEKMIRAASERDLVRIASLCELSELADLAHHLRVNGALTVALLARALISGGLPFFEAAAAELSGLTPEQVATFVRNPYGGGFAALYRRMGIPIHFREAFCVALAALRDFKDKDAGRASRKIAARILARCESLSSPELGQFLALLRRLEAEAAQDEAHALLRGAALDQAAVLYEEALSAAAAIESQLLASDHMLAVISPSMTEAAALEAAVDHEQLAA
ncbi:MAG TPA: DUF2336 domain-containing protein [Roseiarcus sp.]|nr:DUF2336 domain-containing protein [Roseiarcus sp.]